MMLPGTTAKTLRNEFVRRSDPKAGVACGAFAARVYLLPFARRWGRPDPAKGIFPDWTFEATDRVSGRRVTLDRRWQNWPANDPPSRHLQGPTDPYDWSFCEDERMYQAPDGDYVLVWRRTSFSNTTNAIT